MLRVLSLSAILLLVNAASAAALPPCPGSYSRTNWTNCEGTYTWADGRVWHGLWRNGDWDSGKQYAAGQAPPEVYAARGGDAPPAVVDSDEIISASSGSGFAVSSDGHVITNNHVIDGYEDVKIHHKGQSIPAREHKFYCL